MAGKAQKRNPHIGRTLNEYIEDRKAKSQKFAVAFEAEFNRLQLARRVKGLREKRKISQIELAERAGTKQPSIARLESGRVVPKLDLLHKIARALGARLDVRFVET